MDGQGVPQGGGDGRAQGDARRRVAQEDRGVHGLRILPRQGERSYRGIINYWGVEDTGVVTAKNDEQKTDVTRAKILQLIEKL